MFYHPIGYTRSSIASRSIASLTTLLIVRFPSHAYFSPRALRSIPELRHQGEIQLATVRIDDASKEGAAALAFPLISLVSTAINNRNRGPAKSEERLAPRTVNLARQPSHWMQPLSAFTSKPQNLRTVRNPVATYNGEPDIEQAALESGVRP
jgi:hypothetical protein